MFGTQIHLVTFIFICFQGSLIFPSLVNYLANTNQKFRLRFFYLNFLFFLYNLTSGLFPNPEYYINEIAQNIIGFSVGICTAIFLVFYIYKEHNIKPVYFLSIRMVIYVLLADFYIAFIIPYVITFDIKFSRNFFLILPLLFILAILILTLKKLYTDYKIQKYPFYKIKIILGIIALLSLTSLPLTILILGDHQLIEHSLFNISYFVLTSFFVLRTIFLSRIDNKFNKLEGFTREKQLYNLLTDRQKEIAFLIYKNSDKTYDELAELIYIQSNTFSSHCASIFKKLQLQERNKNGLKLFMRTLYK